MGDRPGAASTVSDQVSLSMAGNGKLDEAICKVQELMQASAESSQVSTPPPSFSYAKIAHLALLLCQSELTKEASLDNAAKDNSQEVSHQGESWIRQRAKQHQEITSSIAHLTDMLYAPDASNKEAPHFPEEMRPAARVAKALLVQIQVGCSEVAWIDSVT
eukprot:s5410_g1.t1